MLTAHVDVGILTDAVRKYLIDRITRPREFIDFLNKNSHLVLYGNPVEDDFRLLSRLLEGRGDSLIRKNTETSCCSIVPDINNPFQLFFASENKFSMEIQDNYFVASIEDYEEKFNELSSEKYFRIGDLVSETKLNSWNDLNSGVYLSDIILIDPFIANTDNEETLEKNLFEMLSIFSSNNFLRSLLIFTKPYDWDQEKNNILYKSIRIKCREILGKKVIFGLIPFEKELNEHDRYILMNYQYIQSGNSFSSIFPANGLKKHSNTSTLRIFSIVSPINFSIMAELLKRMKKTLDIFHERKENLRFIDSRLFYYMSQESE